MTGIIVLAVLVLALVAALEHSHRRNSNGLRTGPWGTRVADDRDLARSKLDLLALGGAAEPFTHKPAARPDGVVAIQRARLSQPHNHAA